MESINYDLNNMVFERHTIIQNKLMPREPLR